MKYLLTILIMCVCGVCFADEIQVPFECHPQKIQKAFERNGYKIDLSDVNREEGSIGFIRSFGSKYSIFTYSPVTKEDLEKFTKIAIEARIK